MNKDYQIYYDLENYIRKDVHNKFHNQGYLEAFDFFCVIIWKANRAKSKIAKRLLKLSSNLDISCKQLTTRIFQENSDEGKLHILIKEYGFLLPMSSTILAILYPDRFSIYDYRVCETLTEYSYLNYVVDFKKIWGGYQKYINAVINYDPRKTTFIDSDQNLWGKSFYEQLIKEIESGFERPAENDVVH